jgi:hypothetical protein
MYLVYIVYSKSKIHGVYNNKNTAEEVKTFLEEKCGYNHGVPKRFYYIDTVELNRIPNKMKFI